VFARIPRQHIPVIPRPQGPVDIAYLTLASPKNEISGKIIFGTEISTIQTHCRVVGNTVTNIDNK